MALSVFYFKITLFNKMDTTDNVNSGTMWMDIINNSDIHIANHKYFHPNVVINSDSDIYTPALELAKKFLRKVPEARHKQPGRFVSINFGYEKQFIKYFSKRIHTITKHMERIKKDRNRKSIGKHSKRPRQKRPNFLHADDMVLDNDFYKTHNMDIGKLTHKQQQRFFEQKDCFHEQLYTNVKRFNFLPFNLYNCVIDDDCDRKNYFIKKLQKLYKEISRADDEVTDKYYRQHMSC